MPKSLLLILILFGLSCKGENHTTAEREIPADTLEMAALPPETSPNAMAASTLRTWPEYNALQNAVQAIPALKTRSELSIVLDNIEEKLELLQQSEFPEAFDGPRVKSRLKVMRTYLLKAKAALAYSQDPTPAIREIWEAYGNLNRQFNVIVNNNLDTKLILDE